MDKTWVIKNRQTGLYLKKGLFTEKNIKTADRFSYDEACTISKRLNAFWFFEMCIVEELK